MAKRSFTIHFFNHTIKEWRREDLHLDHGIWEHDNKDVPPERIPRGKIIEEEERIIPSEADWGSESSGFATGTQGWVNYRDVRTGNLVLHIAWDNPYVGSNGLGIEPPDGLVVTHTSIDGNNATVEIHMADA